MGCALGGGGGVCWQQALDSRGLWGLCLVLYSGKIPVLGAAIGDLELVKVNRAAALKRERMPERPSQHRGGLTGHVVRGLGGAQEAKGCAWSECECECDTARSLPLSTQQPHEKKEFTGLRARHKEKRASVRSSCLRDKCVNVSKRAVRPTAASQAGLPARAGVKRGGYCARK